MTTTDKPSIAELQAGARRRMGTMTLQDYDAIMTALLAAAPVLLEIVQAALEVDRAFAAVEGERRAMRVSAMESLPESYAVMVRLSQARASLRDALAKVRP